MLARPFSRPVPKKPCPLTRCPRRNGRSRYRQNIDICAPLAFLLATVSCAATISDPWSYREPTTLAEWNEFYPSAITRLESLESQCPQSLQYRNARAYQTEKDQRCEDDRQMWSDRIRHSFLTTHPDLDPTTRQYVEDGRIRPALSADYVLAQSHWLQDEEREREQISAKKAIATVTTHGSVPHAGDSGNRFETFEYLVASSKPSGNTVGCQDPITLQAVLKYERVGDAYNFGRLAGSLSGPCRILPKGLTVTAVVRQSEYWQVAVGLFGFWVPAVDLRKK